MLTAIQTMPADTLLRSSLRIAHPDWKASVSVRDFPA
jgi:hypothetical protein